MKKIWAVVLSALLVFGVVAFTGCAEEAPEEVEEIEPLEEIEEEEPWWPEIEEEAPEEVVEEEVTGGIGAKILNMASGCENLPCVGGFCVGFTESTLGFCGNICTPLAA